jgi:hypothetical protein
MSQIVIYGGGTFNHVRCHLSLAVPAFGETARKIKQELLLADLRLTRMAWDASRIVTNEDLAQDIKKVITNPYVKYIVMSAAICDFEGTIDGVGSSKDSARLETSEGANTINIVPSPKIIKYIKQERPDIYLVGFKTTHGATPVEQAEKAINMGVDLVLANDLKTRSNLLVTSDTVITSSRSECVKALCETIRKKQSRIIYENDHRVCVQLPTHFYINQNEAFDLAKAIVKPKYEVTHGGWESKIEGAFWLYKVKGKTR